MNIYLIGMIIAMAIFVVIGILVSRSKKVKTAEEFYVAGRQAPAILIGGSLIASYSSTGLFMGDAATAYEGGFTGMLLLAGMQVVGYLIGVVFFGRYLRRSKALTIPEFFGKRFNSKAVRKLAAITAIATMTVYLLSVMQGIGTLMSVITEVDYRICIIVAMVVFTFISVASGSRGVLITDTLMAAVFTVALVLGVLFIAKNTGGWFTSVEAVASNPETTQILSWGGKPGALYNTGWENILWGINYGIVWMSVCAVGPWQSSRYQMAKNEHTAIKSTYAATIGVFLLEFLACIGAVMVRNVVPNMEDTSHVLIYAAMNLMPKIVGVILLTGILAAGISSATTFQSLIGASVANDIF
ncbi:MAG: sodium:solute symporter family protein, partial [Parasporobacterium sp.]|nr:sodium:solute symporter family protein [Parasporobacterium sp.]